MNKYLAGIIVSVVELVLLAAFCFCALEIFNLMALYKDQVEFAGNVEIGKSLKIWIVSLHVLFVIVGFLILMTPHFLLKRISRHSSE
jgi:hypothetical protein